MFKRALLIGALVLLACSLPYTRGALAGQEIWQEKAYLPGFSAIAWGVLAAQLVPVLQRCSRQFSGVLAAVFLAAMLGIFLFGNELWQRYADHYVAMLCVSAAALALCLARLELAPVFGLGWLAKMGALSYEIYLTHMLLILPFVAAAHALCGTKPYAAVLIYPPAVWACYQLGKMAERWVSRPLATQFFPTSRISAPQT